MSLQGVIVALIVLAAALMAIWRLPGDATRLRYLDGLMLLSGGRGPLARLSQRLRTGLLRKSGNACSDCHAAPGDPPGPGGNIA